MFNGDVSIYLKMMESKIIVKISRWIKKIKLVFTIEIDAEKSILNRNFPVHLVRSFYKTMLSMVWMLMMLTVFYSD